MEGDYCVNCGSAGGLILLDDVQIISCIRQWIAPRPVDSNDRVCNICWRKAQEMCASHYICHPCWQRADRAAVQHCSATSTASSSKRNKPLKCVNCGINLLRQRRHILNNITILERVQQQVAPQLVTANNYICGACHKLFEKDSQDSENMSLVGHDNVCLSCGFSLKQNRSHCISSESNQHVLEVVGNWIQPREIGPSVSLCHACFQRAEKESSNAVLPESIPIRQEHAERIFLPNFSRAADTHSRCIFLHCNRSNQKVVPFVLRVKLFRDHKFYIPPECRICEMHLARQSWTDLLNYENLNHSFTAAHIEDFCELLKNDITVNIKIENTEED